MLSILGESFPGVYSIFSYIYKVESEARRLVLHGSGQSLEFYIQLKLFGRVAGVEGPDFEIIVLRIQFKLRDFDVGGGWGV